MASAVRRTARRTDTVVQRLADCSAAAARAEVPAPAVRTWWTSRMDSRQLPVLTPESSTSVSMRLLSQGRYPAANARRVRS